MIIGLGTVLAAATAAWLLHRDIWRGYVELHEAFLLAEAQAQAETEEREQKRQELVTRVQQLDVDIRNRRGYKTSLQKRGGH